MLQFNVEGVKRNKNYLSTSLHTHQPQVIFLQEIWLHYHEGNIMKEQFPSYNFLISSPDMFDSNEDKITNARQAWHGVAVGWHDNLHAHVHEVPSHNARFVGIRLSQKYQGFFLISLYAPTSGKDDEFLECITDLTEYILRNTTDKDRVIIGADSNCSPRSTARRRHCWQTFLDTLKLNVHSTGSPTFHHHNGSSETEIDFFLSSPGLKPHHLQQLCTLETPLNLSSHDVLLASFRTDLKIAKKQSKYSHTYSEFSSSRIIWDKSKIPEYQELAAKALTDAFQYWSPSEATPLLCSLVPSLLVKCAEFVFKTKTPRKMRGATKSRDIRQAEKLLIREHRKWKKAGKPPNKSNTYRARYVSARSNLQQLIRLEENFKNIRNNNDLMQYNITDRNRVYMKMKHMRGSCSRSFTSRLSTPVGTYHDEDVLEGLAADAEFLGKPNKDLPCYDNYFYKLSVLDNLYIFELNKSTQIRIPPMSMSDLQNILHRKMKPNKSCDIYHLTVEHLRECGTEAQTVVLNILNKIINDMYLLSCPQIKLGMASSVYKGKRKPVSESRSYRRITVTPQIGAILDRYVEPFAESIFRDVQSPDQLGFTANLSYLIASVVRGECQRFAGDRKLTCFGVSLDGEAAFPSVERQIQIRELYSAGERGDILCYSKNTYTNTECHLKLNGKISRRISEFKGNRQGHVRASGHYKAYVNPCLTSLSESNLGFYLGPICITCVCVADDMYLLSGSRSALQGALNIVNHYARRYRVKFNAEKTKLVVTGSHIDMNFFKDTEPWTLNGEKVSVVNDNDHLGLIVSGVNEEAKNVDSNIQKCRNSLLSLLGPAFGYKCLLSPTVQVHLWRTYNLPVLRTGLSALPIRPVYMRRLSNFQNKILRGFLKLSNSSPIPALYFLLGELPMEAMAHMDIFSLLFSILSNPDTTAHRVVHYLLKVTDDSSTTWTAHLKILSKKYRTPDPLKLFNKMLTMRKELWKTTVNTNIRIYHENSLREQAQNNSKMRFLNVQTLGLSGIPHIALHNIQTTRDVKKMRAHLKLLCCDLRTGEQLLREGGDPQCQLCLAQVETTEHLVSECRALYPIRERLLPELLNTILDIDPYCGILADPHSPHLTQFLLDCTSQNLPNGMRLSPENPKTSLVFKVARDWCFALINERSKQLKNIKNAQNT